MKNDWAEMRASKHTTSPGPEDWPEHIRPLSMNGLCLFALDPTTNDLYWDGRLVQTRRVVSLRGLELALAIIAAMGTFAAGLHPFGVTFGWW